MAPSSETDFRKALATPHEEPESEKIDEEVRIFKELEAKNIFNKLPEEIRFMIWRHLFRRPATILPGTVSYDVNRYRTRPSGHQLLYSGSHEKSSYRYQWDERRQTDFCTSFYPEYPEGYHHKDAQEMTVAIPTEPTFAQNVLLSRGEKLPFTYEYEDGFGSQVGCEVIERGDNGNKFPQIINYVRQHVHGLSGLAMLQVNKQALSECAQVLYGENTFAFGVSSPTSVTRYNKWNHPHDEFEHAPHLIPGMPQKNGAPQTPYQLKKAINRLFSDDFLPTFVLNDPMLQFLRRIGRVNTSLLTRIKIDGCMKTCKSWGTNDTFEENPCLGFSRVLPVLTTVMKNVCPDLRELTLHMEDKFFHPRNWKTDLVWDEDIRNKARKSDDDRIDECVQKVVTTLDTLKVLKLGGHQTFPTFAHLPAKDDTAAPFVQAPLAFEDEWGRSVRWMKFVKDRASKQAAEDAENAGFKNVHAIGAIDTRTENPTQDSEVQAAQIDTNVGPPAHTSRQSGTGRGRGYWRGRGRGGGNNGRGGGTNGRGRGNHGSGGRGGRGQGGRRGNGGGVQGP